MTSFAIVLQARLGSSRLPGKVLKDFCGVPMIEHIARQASGGRRQSTVLTCSLDESDEPLVEFARRNSWPIFRGPSDDIIGRLLGAAQIAGADAIVRVWGDCPFVCHDVIDEMKSIFERENLDFISNAGDGRVLPVGLDCEIYRTRLLERADREVPDAFLREFPVEFVKAAKPGAKWGYFRGSQKFPVVHMTVDYPEDLEAAREIAQKLKAVGAVFTSGDLFSLLRQEPALLEAFAHQPRQADFIEKLKAYTGAKA